MTENAATEGQRELPDLHLTSDPLDQLTLPEVRIINAELSRQYGYGIDAPTAIVQGKPEKWDAMARVAWVLAKRHNPRAMLAEFTRLDLGDLTTILQPPAPTPPAEDDDDDQAADAPAATLAELGEQAELDPTGS